MDDPDVSTTSNTQPVFRDLDADDPEVTEIESLCLNCGKNGTTRLLLTKIPFYKEVVVASFICPHCHWKNNELQPAAMIQEKGVQYRLRVTSTKDLMRQVVKTTHASVVIPELYFEVPARTQEGTITTVEGVLQRAYDGIGLKLKRLPAEGSEAVKLKEFLDRLAVFKEGKIPFHFVLRDCTGNSFIENVYAPKTDPNMDVSYFERTPEETLMIGIYDTNEEKDQKVSDNGNSEESMNEEVLAFPTNCSNCNAPCVTNMKVTHIPHFKDAVIMATVCDICGNKTTEVKGGSGIEPNGVKITLKLLEKVDLTRDVLKSDTCSINIPELELEVGPNALSGRYTTVEGLISAMKEQLKESNPLIYGDSAKAEIKTRLESFVIKLDEVLLLKEPITLILDDPCGNSYIQSIEDSAPDARLVVEKYERSFEQNEELGLNDMKVENYEAA